MNKEEIQKEKLLISSILFNNNVPISEAKIIGSFIEELEQQNEQLQNNRNELKEWLSEQNFDDIDTLMVLDKMFEIESRK